MATSTSASYDSCCRHEVPVKRHHHIRLAPEHDLPALVRLEEAAFETDRFTSDQIDYLLTRSRATTFILEVDGAPLGAACLLWRKSHQRARRDKPAVAPAGPG